MTEQEAEALVMRLTRIWLPQREVRWSLREGNFYFRCYVVENVTLTYSFSGSSPFMLLEEDCQNWALAYRDWKIFPTCTVSPDEDENCWEGAKNFADQWMSVFRRNCWLSGLPVEASAHEKTEWVQGFTREAIEEWRLTF